MNTPSYQQPLEPNGTPATAPATRTSRNIAPSPLTGRHSTISIPAPGKIR